MFNSKVWEHYYKLPVQSIKDTSLLWFHYQILHKILATNTFLYMIHYADTNMCTFYINYPETLQHLFYECTQVKALCNSVQDWVLTKNLNCCPF